LTKIRLEDGLQGHSERFLYNAILDGWYAQWAHVAMRFRNVHPSDWIWFKRFRFQFFDEGLHVMFQPLIKDGHVYAITPGGSAAGVLFDIIMCESEPVPFMKQAVKIVKTMFAIFSRL
jgi:hypothetical protein